ncbi:minor capsid protein [Burkholderia vietnamiensis]|uniref:minor capsid protein n=1 Tax=Burkholderia vietnamiensis TaxID=60552 RepID=UPI001CB3B975|nr:minor capsid protein [Burkholderia vietnamiensis]CAG9228865.1 conserved hypothetical protein [Burkholderia vietnamiensis]HDR9086359.1 hypothetical protein [Burkholderia vietnamiensis]
MNLEMIAQKLVDAGLGVAGVSIFINEMRAGDEGIMLKESYKGTAIDPNLPKFYRGEFAIVVRKTGYLAARSLAYDAMNALTSQVEETLADGTQIKYILPRHLPIGYPIPQSGLQEFVVNVDCAYVDG